MHHYLEGRAIKSLAAYEVLVALDPQDWHARVSLAGLYYQVQRIPEAVRELEKASVLRPNDFQTAVLAALAWALWAREPDRARPYVDRAVALWPAQANSFSSEVGLANLPPTRAREVAWVLLFPAYDHWRKGDVKAMLTEVQRVLDADPLPGAADRDALLTIAIGLQMTAGRLRDARALTGRLFQERLRELHFAVLADAVDDIRALRHHMARVPLEGEQRAFRLVRAGLYTQAEYVIARSPRVRGFAETARGELALRRGYIAEAIEQLQRGIELARTDTLSERYFAAESLASALERTDRKDEAVDVLHAAAADEPGYGRTGVSGAFWLRVLGRLSLKHRDLGRTAEAAAVDAKLRQLLVAADSDHPLVQQLARFRK